MGMYTFWGTCELRFLLFWLFGSKWRRAYIESTVKSFVIVFALASPFRRFSRYLPLGIIIVFVAFPLDRHLLNLFAILEQEHPIRHGLVKRVVDKDTFLLHHVRILLGESLTDSFTVLQELFRAFFKTPFFLATQCL